MRSTIYVEVPDFALPNDRGFYLAHIQRTLELAHWPDPAKAAGEIIEFEGRLASAAPSLAVQRDAVSRYHPMNVHELQRLAPGFDWIGYFQNRGVAATHRLIVYEPDSVRRMAAIWKNTPLTTLKAWEAWQVTTNASRFLPTRFGNEAFALESKLTGVLELPSNESEALHLTDEIAGEQIGRLDASRYMSETKKRAVRALVQQLVLSAQARIVACGDCAATTKMAALAKLDRLVIDVGYPDHWASTKAEDLRTGDAYGNYDRAYAFYWRRDVRNLAMPVDRHSWEIRPQSVNLWLGSEHMQLGVAAGYLVTPYYQLDADPAINFGAIGAELAHEIGHLFDEQGRLYDASGALTDWWAPNDAIRFTASAAKLRHQVDSYEPLPGIHLNGGLSLGEDIADIEGVRTALDAYHTSLGGKPAPVIDGLTGDQRFFLSYASSHLEKLRPEAMQRQIGSDPHPPDEARVNITVSNVDGWYAAFDIHPDAPMYVPPEQRTRFR